jgi:hypothetical protein
MVTAAEINDGVVAALDDIIGAAPGFGTTFAGTGWFSDTALWLAPQPRSTVP